MNNSKNHSVINALITRYRRNLWIPEDAVRDIITAMNNMIKDGDTIETLPHVYIYPVNIDMDSSSQTGDVEKKNMTAFNDYGILTDIQLETNFDFLKYHPNWRNIFARLGNLNNLAAGLDYPIFIPTDSILIHHFAAEIRRGIFIRNCGSEALPSQFLLPYPKFLQLKSNIPINSDLEHDTEIKSDTSPSEIKSDTSPSEIKSDTSPSEIKSDTSPSEIKSDTSPSEIKSDTSPSETIQPPLVKKRSVKKKPKDTSNILPTTSEIEKELSQINILPSPSGGINEIKSSGTELKKRVSFTLADVTRAIELDIENDE
jgi:hypothetical protein